MARIGLDLDGVLYPFTEQFHRWAESDTGEDLSEPMTWEFYKDWGWSRSIFDYYHRKFVRESQYCIGQLINGDITRGAVARAVAEGHEIVIVTARYTDAAQYPVIREQTEAWLQAVNLPYHELHFSDIKGDFGCDYFLDDRDETFRALCSQSGVTAFLYKQPWNRSGSSAFTGWELPSVEAYINAVLLEEELKNGRTPRYVEPVNESADYDEDFDPYDEVRVTNAATGGQKGSKLSRFDLIPAEALRKVAIHYGIGAEKYEPWNWRKGYDWSLSLAALERHLNAFKAREDMDEETKSPHMAAVAFHALTLLTFMDEHPELDDRYKQEQ